MNFNKKYFIYTIAIVTLLTQSCSLLPISEKNQDIIKEATSKIFEEKYFYLDAESYLEDERISTYARGKLKSVLNLYQAKSALILMADTYQAQAMVKSSENIYISRGMLYAIKNEAEFVALIGHEVGHIQLGHLDQEPDTEGTGLIEDVIETTTGISIPEEVESETKDIYLSQFSQKKEQEADEFGAITAYRLGYDAYAFADLFDRLSELSDKNILKTLQYLKGSHKNLKQRAEHLRKYLKSKGIKKDGKLYVENYLENVGHLGTAAKGPASLKAQKELAQFSQELEKRTQKKQPLSFNEFLEFMLKIRVIAKDLNLLSQLVSESHNISKSTVNFFMMESVKILSPWWAPSNENFEKLKGLLASLSRIGIGATPYVGDSVDLYEVLTGKDFLTNKDLDFGDRVASALGVIAGSGKQWRSVEKELENLGEKVISKTVSEKEVSEVAKTAREAIDEAPIFGKTKKTGETSAEEIKDLQRKYRPIKNQENYKKLKELSERIYEKNIPDDWRVKPSRIKKSEATHQGLEFIHPENDHIRVRVMPGNPKAEWPNSRKPYVVQTAHGKFTDKLGNTMIKESEKSHIPLDDYKFTNFWTSRGKK